MFTKAEIKKMKKGFHPSKAGRNTWAPVGRGTTYGNRKTRRTEIARQKGEHRNKSGILKVLGSSKFRSRVQVIGNKKILHWDTI